MDSEAFDRLMSILEDLGAPYLLPEDWILCTDVDLLNDFPLMATRRKWLRKAKAEILRRTIQERVDEIAEAVESRDSIRIHLFTAAFPEDLKFHKSLSPSQRQKWLDKAALAACGRIDRDDKDRPVIYFVSADHDQSLVKIGHTTNLASRLRSLRTSSPSELQIHLVIPGSRDDEQELHRQFASFRVRREWFKRAKAIDDFIADHRNLTVDV